MSKQKYSTPTLVVNIKRQFFAAILAQPRRKNVEYRDLTDYWEKRLDNVGKPPFDLQLRNGYNPPIPVATVRVTRVVRKKSRKTIELLLGKVLNVKYWNRKKECPKK